MHGRRRRPMLHGHQRRPKEGGLRPTIRGGVGVIWRPNPRTPPPPPTGSWGTSGTPPPPRPPKVTTYVHPEVPTSMLLQALWHAPPSLSSAHRGSPSRKPFGVGCGSRKGAQMTTPPPPHHFPLCPCGIGAWVQSPVMAAVPGLCPVKPRPKDATPPTSPTTNLGYTGSKSTLA